MEYQWPPTLSLQIDAMVERYPHAISLRDGLGAALSYGQMGNMVNSIASELLAHGVQRGDKVAVFQKPSSDWICSLLAILRIGGVYVPLDLRNPMARLATVVQASEPKAILSHQLTIQDAQGLNSRATRIVNISSIPVTSDIVPNISRDGDPAVILFTSGSTGVPKGIILQHSNLAKEIEGFARTWKIGREVVLQQSAFSFDLSLAEIFTGLALGGTLIVVPEHKRGDALEITKLIREENVTYTKATPSEYSSWIQSGGTELSRAPAWRWAFLGGEELKQRHLNEFASLDHPLVRLYNCYGPAEVTISAAKMEVDFRTSPTDDDDRIPVGFALPNYSIYVVNEQLESVAVGIPGEIVISGPGVAAGYLNNEELTKEKFLPDKFANAARKNKGWTTMFRTGDRGCLREDGTLFFHGRVAGNTQIKLRGIRIDLLDIEATMIRASEGVLMDALVSVRTEAQILVAHVVFAKHRQPHDPAKYLQNLLAELPLPQYMRPAFALVLDTMPLTTHSKKDREAASRLSLPQQSELSSSSFELTPIQRRLKMVWEDVLSKEVAKLFDIGPDTDFFTVGGNSLLLIKLQSLIRKSFDAAIPLASLLDASSLGRMATKIEQSSTVSQIDWAEETEKFLGPLTQKLRGSSKGAINGTKRKTSNKVVILTGASGYLGSRILGQLVKDESVSEVHCIAVRRDASGHIPELPITSNKISIHAGDLVAPRLGLSKAKAELLSRSADTIVHCGAKRSFWDNYEPLREVNVNSTKELIGLAALRRIPIHFMSSGAVLDLDPFSASSTSSSSETSAINVRPPRDGSNGYVASKWASETCLQNAATVLGIPVSIYRFTPSRGPNAPHLDILDELLRYTRLVGALPDPAGWKGDVDLVQAEGLSRRICKSVLEEDENSGTSTGAAEESTTYIHCESEIKLNATEVSGFLQERLGAEITETRPVLDWIGRIKKLGFGFMFASQNVSISGSGIAGGSGGTEVNLVSKR